ncbi:MAG: TM1266 family iron-only hydrogenase system putative regulator [Desulfovibrionaceae bacterium]
MPIKPPARTPDPDRHAATGPGADQKTGPTPGAPGADDDAASGDVRRLGVVGILFLGRGGSSERLKELLKAFRHIILYKTGVPCRRPGRSMYCVVIDATTNELGAFTGKLGMVGDVKVKSFLL